MTPTWLSDVRWQHTYTGEGRTFRWGRLGEDYVGEWNPFLVVRADASGSVRDWAAHPTAASALVEKLKYGEAAAFVRALHGKLSLHASAVALEHGAILLTGPSGAGKSTVAWHLCQTFDGSLLADDVAAIDTSSGPLRLEPSERASWLDDGGGMKVAELVRFGEKPTDLTLFVSLRFDDDLARPKVRRLRGAEAARPFLEALLRFDPVPTRWRQEFDVLERLVGAVPIMEVVRPRRIVPSEMAELILKLSWPHQGIARGPT